MQFSWIEPGKLAASEMPFFETDIRAQHAQGIRAILTLTEDPLTFLPEITSALLSALDVRLFHVPVPDDAAPTHAQAREILNFIHSAQKEGHPLLVHCMMGIGRTGTVLHPFYFDQGLSLAEAQSRVQARCPVCRRLSPSQRAFIAAWAEAGTS
uniref:Tyrosine specific protein phosphatases domain-containing protein n=1 Tax=uncultured Armatimonadetes bacterium TaxID=157466 RepID=A0A6J4H7W2_9BACT|nr:hypothetical protein AVDCRST_MAG63-200 [uncultured Armatimonadetes bacterium]